MDKEKAKIRLKKLREEIDDHRYRYNVLDKPIISDAVYDSLFHELTKLEEEYPDLITKDSPTQRVGARAAERFQKITHDKRMLSINDVFNSLELRKWQERLIKMGAKKAIDKSGYYVELKMDGLAVSLKYDQGSLAFGATRGDGRVGEDITQNLKTIGSIPLKLGIKNKEMYKRINDRNNWTTFSDQLEVRGEVFISKNDFNRLNNEREKKGLAKYANPRNVAAGSVRQLDPKITAARDLDFFVYSINGNFNFDFHHQEHELAESLGFKVNKNNRRCKNLEEIQKYLELWQKKSQKLPYQTDGVVIILDDKKAFERLGVVGKAPRGMIAYKFPAEEATSTIKEIILQVGRTGKLTPVAIMEPTLVAGSVVSRATLHNAQEIERKDIRIGDTVIIRKAGDIIPEVVEPIKKMRQGKEKRFKMPKKCPICESEIVKKGNEVDHYCADSNCVIRQKRQLELFVSKNAFNIEGIGPKIIMQLLNEKLVDDPTDFFQLKIGDLHPLERFAEKSAQKIIEAIGNSKKITLDKFIYALGIRFVGIETAIDVAKHFKEIKNILRADEREFLSIYGIGEKVAKSLHCYFSQKKNVGMVNSLQKLGVKILPYHSPVWNKKLRGKSFVITGTLESMTRDDAHKKIISYGGRISSSVTSKTEYLVVGEDPGSKLDKAMKLGVKVISEKNLLDMIS